jgi:guanylate kinase
MLDQEPAKAPITFVICGAGGAGKGSIVEELMKSDPALWLSRSWTTRPRREGESENAYVFVSPSEFQARVDRNGFYEWAQFFEHRYGTPIPEVPFGWDLVLEIDVQGAVQVIEREPKAVVILVLPPSREEQKKRMRIRGDKTTDISKRLAKSDAEEKIGKKLANLIVVNVNLVEAVSEVSLLITEMRRLRKT